MRSGRTGKPFNRMLFRRAAAQPPATLHSPDEKTGLAAKSA